jgi:hypothetical protein
MRIAFSSLLLKKRKARAKLRVIILWHLRVSNGSTRAAPSVADAISAPTAAARTLTA